jgi:hypothetical protein
VSLTRELTRELIAERIAPWQGGGLLDRIEELLAEAEAKGRTEGRDECLAEARKLAAEYEAKGRAEALEEASALANRRSEAQFDAAKKCTDPARRACHEASAIEAGMIGGALAAQKPEPRT